MGKMGMMRMIRMMCMRRMMRTRVCICDAYVRYVTLIVKEVDALSCSPDRISFIIAHVGWMARLIKKAAVFLRETMRLDNESISGGEVEKKWRSGGEVQLRRRAAKSNSFEA